MTYDEWEITAAPELRGDSIWRMRVYRLACYLADVGWDDAFALKREPLAVELASQLISALGSIRASLAEGYSRSGGKDRARIFEYALGSARESREWYYHARRILGAALVAERCAVLEEIIRLLLAIVPRERARKLTRWSPGSPRSDGDQTPPREP
jgi:four helix bundle protein